jgi:tRNA-dihydrouridine synthase
MVARGALRFPFIFLESMASDLTFSTEDYLEVLLQLKEYFLQDFSSERQQLIQWRKHILWFAAGYPRSAKFRQQIFQIQDLAQLEQEVTSYFQSIQGAPKHLDLTQEFMSSGHG